MDFPILPGSHRILNVHQNVPGVLKNVNNIIADLNVNIKVQVSSTQAMTARAVLRCVAGLSGKGSTAQSPVLVCNNMRLHLRV